MSQPYKKTSLAQGVTREELCALLVDLARSNPTECERLLDEIIAERDEREISDEESPAVLLIATK